MNSQTLSTTYHYADESPLFWESFLSQQPTGTTIVSDVSWAVHESAPGIYDFSKSSRLRLEKFLTLAAQAKLAVDLRVGILSDRDAVPGWALAVSEKNLIPEEVYSGSERRFGWRKVPHLFHPALKGSFLNFLDEVFRRVELYRAPEGPVRQVRVELGHVPFSQTVGGWNAFLQFLRTEYQDIGVLNGIYQTAFRNFESLNAMAYRTLLDKRPWQACCDFKNYRAAWLTDLHRDITALVERYELVAVNQDGPAVHFSSGEPIVFYEDMQVEALPSGRPMLLAPWGEDSRSLIRGFRQLEFLYEKLRAQGTRCAPLSSLTPSYAHDPVMVFCGKYISLHAKATLTELMRQGKQILFQMESPRLTERLASVQWPEGANVVVGRPL